MPSCGRRVPAAVASVGAGGAGPSIGLSAAWRALEIVRMADGAMLLEVRGLSKTFVQSRSFGDLLVGQPAPALQAGRDLSFAVRPRGTPGIVGGSRCGQSNPGRCIARLP